VRVADYNIGDESKIIELFETVFKQKLSLERWFWRFRDNPAGKYFIKLMWDKDKLVGHYAVSPLIMKVDGVDCFTALSLTTMTHPHYQGKGIFGALSLDLYKDLEQSHNCKAIWGFPNNNSHYAFIKKLDWQNLAVMHTLGLSLQYLKPKGVSFKCKVINKFDLSHEECIDKKLSAFAKVYTKPSNEYLNWRFINKPDNNYKCYKFESESGTAILITKPYYNKQTSNSILNLIYCHMDNCEEIHDYIKYIKEDLNTDFESVTLWKSLWDPDHLSLEKQRFVPQLPQTYLASRIHHSMPDAFSDFRNWSLAMSDSDVF